MDIKERELKLSERHRMGQKEKQFELMQREDEQSLKSDRVRAELTDRGRGSVQPLMRG